MLQNPVKTCHAYHITTKLNTHENFAEIMNVMLQKNFTIAFAP